MLMSFQTISSINYGRREGLHMERRHVVDRDVRACIYSVGYLAFFSTLI
jgi:hypothetical protein